jgi:hypothetical protein
MKGGARFDLNTLRSAPPPPNTYTVAEKRMYIKLPMYLFLNDLMILVRANPLLWPLEEVGLKIWTFLGPNNNSLRWLPFQGTKVYRFLGLTSSKALEWIYPHQNH